MKPYIIERGESIINDEEKTKNSIIFIEQLIKLREETETLLN